MRLGRACALHSGAGGEQRKLPIRWPNACINSEEAHCPTVRWHPRNGNHSSINLSHNGGSSAPA